MIKYMFLAMSFISTTLNPVSVAKVNAPLNNGPENTTILSVISEKKQEIPESAYRTLKVWVTAYSSTPEETDDTPFLTASGENVRDGIIATNFLPFGTLVKIPEHFGDKVFEVQDRMHKRKTNFIDVWMPTKQDAKEFGIYETEIIVIESEI